MVSSLRVPFYFIVTTSVLMLLTCSHDSLAASLSGGFRILSDRDSGLALNAYGGAREGGEVRLWKNCSKSNPDCMWMYVNGMIVSMSNPDLAIQHGRDLSTLTLSRSCFKDALSYECTWEWKNGMFYAPRFPTRRINAYGGAKHRGQLKVNAACDKTNPDCTWTIESAQIGSSAASRLGVNAYGGATDGTTLKLYEGCPASNPDCTWTFKKGRILADRDQHLGVNAYAAQGKTLKLYRDCPESHPDCTWTLDRGAIKSDTNPDLWVRASGGAANGVTLKLDNDCSLSKPDCVFDIRSLPSMPSTWLTAPSLSRQKQIPISLWENVLLAIPPNRAGCGANGAVFIPEGGAETSTTWRADLTCMTSTSPTCAGTETVYGSVAWPIVNIPGFIDYVGSADQQIVRFTDGSILMSHQGVRRDAGTTAPCGDSNNHTRGTCRGVEYFFRSTDCGATWSYVTILDPASDGPTSDPDRCYNRAYQAGHDRPELYADPYKSNIVYMTVMCAGDTTHAISLYRSNNTGTTWNYVGEIPSIWTGAYMTTVSDGTLYIAGWYNDGSGQRMGLVKYKPWKDTISAVMPIGSPNLERHPGPCLRISAGSEGISRVGRRPDGDYLRVHNTYKDSKGDYSLVVRLVRVSGNTATVIQTDNIDSPPGRSFVGATSIESDRLELMNNLEVNPAVIYMYEIQTAGCANFGPGKLRYVAYPRSGLDDRSTGVMSDEWPIFTDVYGDYQKGAFWFDRGTSSFKFMQLWGEQMPVCNSYMRTNFMSIPVW